jgi:sulfopyruvate decarboxylase TPP-binding subunit
MELAGVQVAAKLEELGFSHVIWLPDSATGPWESALERSETLRLIRVCREGEAWGIATGLHLGGAQPLVIIQSTGFFESGDALRNALFDLRLPLYAIVGHRSALVPNSPDTAKHFLEPIIRAWGIDYITLTESSGRAPLDQLAEHVERCRAKGQAGVALLPEGRM